MFEQNCRIRFSEIDRTGHLSMEGLLRLFQDIGYAHAQERKLGVDYTKEHHYTWYLLSWNIHAISMPMLGEHVTMKTWFYKLQGTLARKNVVMYDDYGRCLAAADTMWVYIDVETQKPAMAPAGQWPQEDFGERSSLVTDGARRIPLITVPDGENAAGGGVIALPSRQVTPYLLDPNHHANNTKLVELAMHVSGVSNRSCHVLKAEFKRQLLPDTVIYPYMEDQNGEILVAFKDEQHQDYAAFVFQAE